jgi:acetoacetate decarboxylase
MDGERFAESFSMPIGAGLYPPPPYHYRDVEDHWVTFEADAGAVDDLLPPGIVAADDAPVCSARARHVPFSTFGTYNEAYLMIRVLLDGEPCYYQPYALVDGEAAMVAGREIWGYGKKLARIERRDEGEQTIVTVERPVGQRIMTLAYAAGALADVGERKRLPVLSTRIIPSCEAGELPAVAELVRLDGNSTVHLGADGTPKIWSGRGSLTFDAESAADPWFRLRPTRIIGAFHGVFDFDLPAGRSVIDYRQQPDLWARPEPAR